MREALSALYSPSALSLKVVIAFRVRTSFHVSRSIHLNHGGARGVHALPRPSQLTPRAPCSQAGAPDSVALLLFFAFWYIGNIYYNEYNKMALDGVVHERTQNPETAARPHALLFS